MILTCTCPADVSSFFMEERNNHDDYSSRTDNENEWIHIEVCLCGSGLRENLTRLHILLIIKEDHAIFETVSNNSGDSVRLLECKKSLNAL